MEFVNKNKKIPRIIIFLMNILMNIVKLELNIFYSKLIKIKRSNDYFSYEYC